MSVNPTDMWCFNGTKEMEIAAKKNDLPYDVILHFTDNVKLTMHGDEIEWFGLYLDSN